MFDHIILEEGQIDLLNIVVEASRNTPKEKRREFSVISTFGGDVMIHPGLVGHQTIIYKGDVSILGRYDLLNIRYGNSGGVHFDVTPTGFRYYEYLHSQKQQPMQQIENVTAKYLEMTIQVAYPNAYSKWQAAEQLLWKTDSGQQLTAIGHHCREAMQEFSSAIVVRAKLPNSPSDPSRTVARIRSVVDARKQELGDGISDFLDALLVYWGTLNDLVQRQEHGAKKEGKPLIWLDGRRIVFHTAMVMLEIDSAVFGSSR